MTMNAPDGRSLLFEVREGEQHDLWGVAKGYTTAFKLHHGAVKQIVDAIWAKLPPAVFVLPVAVSADETLQLRVTEVCAVMSRHEVLCDMATTANMFFVLPSFR